VNGFGRSTQKLTAGVKVPRSRKQSICVRATDAAGNRSPWTCAKVTVTMLIPEPTATPTPVPSVSPVPVPVPSPDPGGSPAP